MAADMAELMALLRAPNRTSSNSTPSPGYGPTVDPNPWVQPTHAPEGIEAPAIHAPAGHPANVPPPPATLSVAIPLSPLDPTMLVPPPIFSYPALPPLNIPIPEPGTPTQAVPTAPPTNFLPETGTEQEQRLKKMEENIKALQSSGSCLDTGDGDWSLFPGMHLPPKIKDSLAGAALDWYMSLKTADIPTWADLLGKFIDQYKYCAETPPTLLELSTMEMAEDQGFEAYAVKWRARAAKHVPPISKAQQIQLFHSTLKGAYYLHLLAHTSSFSNLIDDRKKLDIGVKLGKIEGPAEKKEGESSKKAATGDQSRHCEYHQGAPGHNTDNCWKLREKIQAMIDDKQLTFNAVKPPNVQANPLPDHCVCAIGEYETGQEPSAPFIIEYVPAETGVAYAGFDVTPAPFVIEVPTREPYQDSKVPWTYEGSVGNLELQFSVMGVTRSRQVYENSEAANKGKAPAPTLRIASEATPVPQKKVTEEEAEAFIKIIKASEYKVVEQIGKSLAHISLLALLLGSEPHRKALLKVLTAAQCNNFVVGRVMIDNGSALNVCPVSTLKQMNVDLNRIRPSKTAVRAFDGSRREVNGEIDLLIKIGPCSFSVIFQVLDIPNAFSLLLGRPWIHSAGAIPSTLHQKLKFIVEERLITIKGEEDYAIYKETAVPYISIGDDHNLPFHSFDTISVIRDYRKTGPSRADRMVGKILLRHNYISGSGLGAHGQGINCPIEIEEYKNRRGLGFRPSCHEIVEARRSKHLHRLAAHYGKINRGTPVPPLSHFFSGPQHIVGGTLDGRSSDSDDKKDGRARVCVDYRDLNKTSPKDNFPLPHINVLVDNTARHNQFSFMDGFSGYNQIRMAEEDKIKTSFITMWGTFCYMVMPFGLKNAEATYQWAMFTLFQDMMHKEIERFRQYTLYHTIRLLSKADPLKYLLGSPSSMRNIAKWRCQLTEYDIEYVPRTSVKGQAIADHLAEFPVEDDTLINSDFPDEGILQVDEEENGTAWKMYFDDAMNSTGSGIGAVLISPDGRYYPIAAKVDFHCTNNVAEYEACILGLQAAIDFKFADALVTLASMVSITKENLIEPLEIEIAKGPAHCNAIEVTDEQP
ncbi:hypothetical protein CRG98_039676 [Punica granatum]|uniref:G-patch domain-containing protein n=1 Tax=Punica granatum TaxID=22663 RepID=A0A2I0I7I0_PUNGR|nr:hypothetical protein CRG98_039676 [Punica granatum]